MYLDVRVPIGVLFCLIGVVVVGYGAMTIGDPAARPTGIAINLVWGGVMFAFGAVMLVLAANASRKEKR